MAGLFDEFYQLSMLEADEEREKVCRQRGNDCYGCPYEIDCAAEDTDNNDDYWRW